MRQPAHERSGSQYEARTTVEVRACHVDRFIGARPGRPTAPRIPTVPGRCRPATRQAHPDPADVTGNPQDQQSCSAGGGTGPLAVGAVGPGPRAG